MCCDFFDESIKVKQQFGCFLQQVGKTFVRAKINIMFGLFKKKSKTEVLMEKYKKLQEEAFILSKTDRKAADAKLSEAEEVMKEIEGLS